MKKLIALVIMLCLCCTAALAEEKTVVTWADVEGALAESGVTGAFATLDVLGLQIFVPNGLNPVEVPEADAAAGRLYLFMADDQSAYLTVDALNVEGMTLDQLFENSKASETLANVEMVNINGLDFVVYQNTEANIYSACLVDTNSNVIVFSMGPASEDGAEQVFFIVTASLQPAA